MTKSPKSSRKKKHSVTSINASSSLLSKDPIPPSWIPPQEGLGEKLLQAVEYKPLEEKDLYGMKISKRALKNLSPAEIRDLVEVFQTFDREKTGSLKARELFYALKSLGFNVSESICEEYIDSETDGSSLKALSLNQFLDLIIDKQNTAKDNYDEILNGFRLFDYDTTGYISIENLRRACVEADCNLTETDLKEMIQEVKHLFIKLLGFNVSILNWKKIKADQNGDGLVDQSEFMSVILKTNLY